MESVPPLSPPWQPSHDIQANIPTRDPDEAIEETKKSLPAVLPARFDGTRTSLEADAQSLVPGSLKPRSLVPESLKPQSLVPESLTSLSTQYPARGKRNRTSSVGTIANRRLTTLGSNVAQRRPVAPLVITLHDDTLSQRSK